MNGPPESSPPASFASARSVRSGRWTVAEALRQRLITHAPRLLPKRLVKTAADTCGILMYHRIAAPTPGLSFPTSNVTPRRFGAQLAGLLGLGFEAWPLRRLLEHHHNKQDVPRNIFVVTFDDGYENNFTAAWPILKELNVPATIFISTAYLDSPHPFPFEDWSDAKAASVPGDHV
ncbi:MAG: polysaccharide deacetylase family protein, partial [Pirellulales bacterium]|nr:polysaccharide deacetylase family protein [Pirellulales bacterium]